MPPIVPNLIGGISTDFTSHSERYCMPPYTQNSAVADTYMIVHANNDSDSRIADEEKA